MSHAHEIAGKATAIEKTNGFNAYKASNKVSVTDYLQENTTYYYQYMLMITGVMFIHIKHTALLISKQY